MLTHLRKPKSTGELYLVDIEIDIRTVKKQPQFTIMEDEHYE
jgi:hypothetical protein